MLAHAGQRSTGDLVCGLADVPIYYIDSILRLTKAEALQNRFIPVLPASSSSLRKNSRVSRG